MLTKKEVARYSTIHLACLADLKKHYENKGKAFPTSFIQQYLSEVHGVVSVYCFYHDTKRWISNEEVIKEALGSYYLDKQVYELFNVGDLEETYNYLFFKGII